MTKKKQQMTVSGVVGGTILHWLPDADMRCSHDGLREMIKKKLGVRVEDLKPGQFVMCVNTSRNQFKMYAANNFLIHYKRPEGRAALNPKALLLLPGQFMRRQRVSYDHALRDAVIRDYTERHPLLAKTLDAEWRTV